MKNKLHSYMYGFLKGFDCMSTFWQGPRFKSRNKTNAQLKSIDEMNRESIDKAWYQVGQNLRQAYDNIAMKYGYKNE